MHVAEPSQPNNLHFTHQTNNRRMGVRAKSRRVAYNANHSQFHNAVSCLMSRRLMTASCDHGQYAGQECA